MSSARPLAYARRFSPEETEILVRGIVPLGMEDHWFIFEEDDVLHLYRSWTGHELFTIQLRRLADGGAEIAEVMLNNELSDEEIPRREWWQIRRRPLPRTEDREAHARYILAVLFDSISPNPNLAVGLIGDCYGLGSWQAREAAAALPQSRD